MDYENKTDRSSRDARMPSNNTLLVGIASGLALIAGFSLLRPERKSRRYADAARERRRPANMFAAGAFPHRRKIDRSGERPLFERRQSAYDEA